MKTDLLIPTSTFLPPIQTSRKIIPEMSHTSGSSIHRHVLNVSRAFVQFGIPNERYPASKLYNYRLTYHCPTDAILTLKNFRELEKDAKFTDAQSIEDPTQFAEGKCVNHKSGVNFNPSVNTGAGRGFKQCDLDDCFAKNSFYFLYEAVSHDDTYLTFYIYWIPIHTIRAWYSEHGNKGKITYTKFKRCIQQAQDRGEIVQTQETRG